MRFERYQGEDLDWEVGANLDEDSYALEGRGLPERTGTCGQIKLRLLDVMLPSCSNAGRNQRPLAWYLRSKARGSSIR
jgi:hypothetical protein